MPTITDWLTSITTLVLVCITGYYAIINHLLLKNQREQIRLEKRPFISFEGVGIKYFVKLIEDEIGGIQLSVKFKNVSKVLIKYEIKKVLASINNITKAKPNLINTEGYLYPSQSIDYSYDTIENQNIKDDIINGEIEYEIEYYSEKIKKYTTKKKIGVIIYTKSKTIEWKFISEEEN
jgi:hypothetical protein